MIVAIPLGILFCSDCSIRVSQFFMQNMISCRCSTFNKVNPAPFMLEYDFQPVVTSLASIALNMMIVMMTIDASGS